MTKEELNQSPEQLAKTLESKIYSTYYDANPEGDARYDLWPAVIEANGASDPVEELTCLLEQVELGYFS
tara:strand:- start:33984 stop:34190 length:207 start_codon:yes stop_codon:yes gene_type:complete